MTRRLGIAVLTALLTLALVEGGARLALGGDFQPDVVTDLPMNACVAFDPELGWVNRAGLVAEATGPTMQMPVFRYRVTINSKGLRDHEHAYAAAPGVTRIVALGDSFTWGWGVDDGESWPDQLGRLLGAGHEVVNLGVPGYSTDQELLAFEREGVRYGPRLVVLCLLLNDVEGNHDDFRDGLGKPRLERDADGGFAFANLPVQNTSAESQRALASSAASGWRGWARRHLALVQLAARTDPEEIVRKQDDSPWADRPIEEVRELLLEWSDWPFFDDEDVVRYADELVDPASPTHELLRRLRQRCSEAGAELLVFSVAHYHDYYLTIPGKPMPPEVAEARAAGLPYRSLLARRLEQAGRAIGFETLSVDDAMLRAVEAGENLNVGDGHLTARGNEILARELARWVEARALGR